MKVALYLRVSDPSQARDDKQSIPTQERVCLAVAAAKGDEVVAVYIDAGATAYKDELDHRPEFRRLLDDAPRGLFGRLYVYMLDRFSRASIAAAGEWLQQLEAAGVELVSASEWFDASPAGEFTRNMLLSQSRYFSRLLSVRIKDAFSTKLRRGGFVGHIPYGYDGDGQGQLRVNEAEAAGYELAVKTLLDGAGTFEEIAAVLNAAGYRTKRNYPWAQRSIAYMLRNPTYLGCVPVGRKGKQDLLPGTHPPLLDRATWERVQARCGELAKRYSPRQAKYPYPLSGLLYCARCGARLQGSMLGRQGYDWRGYICAQRKMYHSCDLPKIKASTVEELVARELDRLVLPATWREQVRAAAAQERPAGPSEESLRGEERRLTRLYQEGFIPYAEFKEKWAAVQAKRQAATPPAVDDVLLVGALLEQGLGAIWRQTPDVATQHQLARAVFAALYVDHAGRNTPVLARLEWAPAMRPLRALVAAPDSAPVVTGELGEIL